MLHPSDRRITASARHFAEIDERAADARQVLALPSQRQRLLVKRVRAREVSCPLQDDAEVVQRRVDSLPELAQGRDAFLEALPGGGILAQPGQDIAQPTEGNGGAAPLAEAAKGLDRFFAQAACAGEVARQQRQGRRAVQALGSCVSEEKRSEMAHSTPGSSETTHKRSARWGPRASGAFLHSSRTSPTSITLRSVHSRAVNALSR